VREVGGEAAASAPSREATSTSWPRRFRRAASQAPPPRHRPRAAM